MIDTRIGQLEILQTVMEAVGKGSGDLLGDARSWMANMGVSEEQFLDLTVSLKMARLLDVAEGPRTEEGDRVIERINGITTRGLRTLQQASEPPREYHSCPTDGEDGRLGFLGD